MKPFLKLKFFNQTNRAAAVTHKKMANADTIKNMPRIDSAKPFQFLYVESHDFACCPHCGAEGKNIYHWAEYGALRAAMAGCYKALTGKLAKDDYTQFMEKMSSNQARNKPLSGFQKTVARMMDFMRSGKYPADWCQQKIMEAIKENKRFAAKKWGGH